MELHHLRHFVAVAEELHFGRAAARLRMAQPPLSQSIMRLEAFLDAQLFERSRRKVELTDAGRIFLEETRRTLNQVERSRAAVKRAVTGEVGGLRIGIFNSALHGCIPDLIRRFQQSSPDVDLRFEELSSGDQIERLLSDKLDIGFIVPPRVEPPEISKLLVEQWRWVLAVPSDWEIASKPVVCLRELIDLPFIMSPREQHPSLHDSLVGACLREGFSPRIAHHTTRSTTSINLVAAGFGVTFYHEVKTAPVEAGVTLLHVTELAQLPPINLAATWINPVRSPILNRFLGCIRESVARGINH